MIGASRSGSTRVRLYPLGPATERFCHALHRANRREVDAFLRRLSSILSNITSSSNPSKLSIKNEISVFKLRGAQAPVGYSFSAILVYLLFY